MKTLKTIKASFLYGWYKGKMERYKKQLDNGQISSDLAYKEISKAFVGFIKQYSYLVLVGEMEYNAAIGNALAELLLKCKEKEEAQA